MLEAFIWGFAAAFSLVIGDILAVYIRIPRRILGLVLAFGVGVLISAVSFELVEKAFGTAQAWTVAGLFCGAFVFYVGDVIIDRLGGRRHRRFAAQRGDNAEGSGLAIVLGTVLDGIPESIVIGLTLVKGGVVSAAMVAAVFLSNLPEAIGGTSGLRKGGWKRAQTLGMWLLVVLASGFASLLGYAFFDTASPQLLSFTLSFAGGALLTMVADSMLPEAYRDSGKLVGLITTLGFGLAFIISALT